MQHVTLYPDALCLRLGVEARRGICPLVLLLWVGLSGAGMVQAEVLTGYVRSASADRLVLVTDRGMVIRWPSGQAASLAKGTEVKVVLNENTKFLRGAQRGAVLDLKRGDAVAVSYDSVENLIMGELIATEVHWQGPRDADVPPENRARETSAQGRPTLDPRVEQEMAKVDQLKARNQSRITWLTNLEAATTAAFRARRPLVLFFSGGMNVEAILYSDEIVALADTAVFLLVDSGAVSGPKNPHALEIEETFGVTRKAEPPRATNPTLETVVGAETARVVQSLQEGVYPHMIVATPSGDWESGQSNVTYTIRARLPGVTPPREYARKLTEALGRGQ